MKHDLDELAANSSSECLAQYWPNFQPLAFAIYDEKQVYLYHHPSYSCNSCTVLPKSNAFAADTLIMFENYPVAIVNSDRYQESDKLYAVLVHELFHGHQYHMNEERFPDEMLGLTYPLSEKNEALRKQERYYLYKAVAAFTEVERMEHLYTFIALREKRQEMLKEHLDYELKIETVEGSAHYVEFQAYASISSQAVNVLLEASGAKLLKHDETIRNLRKSCYASGLFICFALDKVMPGWKKGFFESKKTVYELLKSAVGEYAGGVVEAVVTEEIRNAIKDVTAEREAEFQQFAECEGCHVTIEGSMTVKMIDPMNISASASKFLHHNFVKVAVNRQEYHIQQPAVTYYNDQFKNIYKLQFVLDEEPEQTGSVVRIGNIGKIKGHLLEEGNRFKVIVS